MHFEVAGLFREAVGVGVRRTSHCKFLCVAKKKAEGACVIMCECVALSVVYMFASLHYLTCR